MLLPKNPFITQKEKEKKEEKRAEPLPIVVRPKLSPIHQQISKQGNKTITGGKEEVILKLKGSGFIQTIIIRWSHGSQDVSNITLQLDLGADGSITVDFNEYYLAGITTPHSAQDFWISEKDDSSYIYAMALTPAIPLRYRDYMRVHLKNNNTAPITLDSARVKYYTT